MQIADARVAEILEGQTAGLPADAEFQIRRMARLLLACKEERDISVFADVYEDGNLLAIPIMGRWWLVFDWNEGAGASELQLKRR